jgi:hypothetical protein
MMEMTGVTLPEQLDESAAFEPREYPFVGLDLNDCAEVSKNEQEEHHQ